MYSSKVEYNVNILHQADAIKMWDTEAAFGCGCFFTFAFEFMNYY